MSRAIHLKAAEQHDLAAMSYRAAAADDSKGVAMTAAKHAAEAQNYSAAAYEASEKALAKSTSTLPTK